MLAIGFVAWTCWQVAAIYIPVLPSIPLIGAEALWILWFIIWTVPITVAALGSKTAINLQKKEEEIK